MCVICVKPEGSIFTLEQFNQCFRRNGHGIGFVAIKGKKIVFEKGLMTEKEGIEASKKYWGKDWGLILHFRISSRGAVNQDLTHPFKYSQNNFLFQNGTITTFNLPAGASDTEYLASLLDKLPPNDVDAFLKYASENKHGKFVTVVDGKINIYVSEKQDTWANKNPATKDGVWFSNTIHESAAAAGAYGDDDHYCGYPSHSYTTSEQLKNDNINKLCLMVYEYHFGPYQEWKDNFLKHTKLYLLPPNKISNCFNKKDLAQLIALER